MYVQVGLERVPYDFETLATGSRSTSIVVGNFVDTSGVKSGVLVLQARDIVLPTSGTIGVAVLGAVRQGDGTVFADVITPVASYEFSTAPSGSRLIRAEFDSIPGPGVIVAVFATRGATTGPLSGTFTIGLELLPT